jgi:hypothetical protein
VLPNFDRTSTFVRAKGSTSVYKIDKHVGGCSVSREICLGLSRFLLHDSALSVASASMRHSRFKGISHPLGEDLAHRVGGAPGRGVVVVRIPL